MHCDLRGPDTLVAPLVAASWTLRRTADEGGLAVLTLPAHPLARLPPRSSELLQLLLNLRVAVCFGVARIARRPLLQLGWLAGALGAPDVPTVLADGGGGGDKDRLALVAGAADQLLRWLICQLVARARCHSQDPLLPRLVVGGHPFLFRDSELLLGVAGALLASRVLALRAYLVRSIDGAAPVTAAVHTHADGLLHALHRGHGCWGSDPVVRVQREAILGEESARPLLLHCVTVKMLSHTGGWRDSGFGGSCWLRGLHWRGRSVAIEYIV